MNEINIDAGLIPAWISEWLGKNDKSILRNSQDHCLDDLWSSGDFAIDAREDKKAKKKKHSNALCIVFVSMFQYTHIL